MDDLRIAVQQASSYDDAAAFALIKVANWRSDALGDYISAGLQLSALMARDAVFREMEDETDTDLFADDTAFGLTFKKQIEFLTQKRVKPTKRWTDAMRGDHDRAFVVAGATDLDMLKDFQNSLVKSRTDGTLFKDFQKDFDRIAEKYGWEFNGGRTWRARTIFETNMRTSYMAGRLAQMRDPDVVKARPFWQYRHGVTRTPKRPRPAHLGWHGLTLPWDDPTWQTLFAPNGWKCSCSIVTRSARDMEREGRSGPDKPPVLETERHFDRSSGEFVDKVKNIDYGFEYMPGDLWERGLVPSELIREAGGISRATGLVVQIDEPRPIAELIKDAVAFKSKPLKKDKSDNTYIDAFLKPFGATRQKAVRFIDKSGTSIPISVELFKDRAGNVKVKKRGREIYTAMIGEAIRDPDEIWLGVRGLKLPDSEAIEYIVDRRYIRVDPATGLIIVFQLGDRGWEAVTAFQPSSKGKPSFGALDGRRGGKLIYERKK